MIQKIEPPTLSAKLRALESAAAVAECRKSGLNQLLASLRRELEWIPLMAMRKDPNRRYQSPAELAVDIQSYLEGRPLRAGPEAASYRVRKFLVRRRLFVTAVTSLVLLVVLSVSFYIRRIRHEQSLTELAKNDAERQSAIAVSRFRLCISGPEKGAGPISPEFGSPATSWQRRSRERNRAARNCHQP